MVQFATFVNMSAKTIRIILVLMLLTIAGLFVTQAYWFKKSFSVQESQFDDKMNIALRNVAHQLLLLQNDSTSKIPPVSKLSSNEYKVETKTYFSLYDLDSLLNREFNRKGIIVDYDYLIIQEESNKVILGNSNYHKMLSNLIFEPGQACKSRWDDPGNRDFKIRINNKTGHLLGAMGIWMYSSVTLLLILAVFTFIIVSIIKGKRLSLLKKDFVNNMTHELKTPIANISVASEAIRNDSIKMDASKLQKYADIIYKENNRLHQLVDRVLQISAIEKDEDTLALETVNIHEVIAKTVGSFEALIQTNKGTLTTEMNATKFQVLADGMHISNVVYNLIENAIKYSSDSPKIKVITVNTESDIQIAISDNGIGIGMENKERIFEKFFREESGNLHNTKGYGLGLSYVKLIAEKHNGSISFTTKQGEGSTFTLKLPL